MEELKDYRCSCGKLLLRGHLLVSIVEIKCKKCGNISVFNELENGLHGQIVFHVDKNGKCGHVIGDTRTLGYRPEEFVGKDITQFFPTLGSEDLPRGTLAVADNHFIARDGSMVPLESYFVCDYDGDKVSGYRMFNWLKKNKTNEAHEARGRRGLHGTQEA